MEFRFKTTEKYHEAYEHLLRVHQSFCYSHETNVIKIDQAEQSLIEKLMEICGECDTPDELLAKEIMKQNVAR